MKKVLAILLAMAMLFGMAACSSGGSTEPAADSSSVIDKTPDSRRQWDEKHAHRYRPERTA